MVRVRTLSPGFVRPDPTTAELELFERLPALMGGAFHGPGNRTPSGRNIDAVTAIRGAIDEFRQSYVIQYTPRNVAAGGWHDVIVLVKPSIRTGCGRGRVRRVRYDSRSSGRPRRAGPFVWRTRLGGTRCVRTDENRRPRTVSLAAEMELLKAHESHQAETTTGL